jgi:hypothetical protein
MLTDIILAILLVAMTVGFLLGLYNLIVVLLNWRKNDHNRSSRL